MRPTLLLLPALLAAGEAAPEPLRLAEERYRAAVEAALRRYDAELAALAPAGADAAAVAAERKRVADALPARGTAVAVLRLEPSPASYASSDPGTAAVWWLETDGHHGTGYLAFPLGTAGATAGQLLLRSADAADAESETGLVVLCGPRVVGSLARLPRNQELRVPIAGLPESGPFTLVLVGGGSDGAGLVPGGTLLLVPGGGAPTAPPPVAAAPPQPPAAAPVGLLDEGFDDQAALARWKSTANRIAIADGILTFTGGNHGGISSAATVPTEDVVIEFRGSADTGGFHCYFGPYNVNFGSYGNSQCAAGIFPDQFTSAKTGKVFEPGQWRTYRIERRGDRLAGYVDDVLKVERSITSRSDKPAGFAMTAYNSTLRLDWLRVRPAEPQVPRSVPEGR